MVDAYTKRIFSRLGFVEPTVGYEELKALFELNLDKKTAIFNEYHALLVEHGKNICKKKAFCSACPLADLCEKRKSRAFFRTL